jgi:flagellar FliL protein
MSAAAAAGSAPAASPPAKGGKKKLIIIIAALLVVLLAGGAGAVVYLKKKAADAAAAAEEEDGGEHKAAKADPAHPPTFLPLDPFVVNLADKDSDRFAQIGITLEVADPAFADKLRAYMPAIRNSILLILAHKTSAELLGREGKEQLAAEIQRETVRPMGIELDDGAAKPSAAKADAKADADTDAEEPDDEHKPKPKKKKRSAPNPVRHVHFSSFIIQ